MDRTVPTGAALLLGFIYETETSATAPACYGVIYGNRQGRLAKPLTAMTLAEVQAAQLTWSTKAWAAQFNSSKASSAAGAPQLMRATLADLIEKLRLDPRQKLDADLQDRLGYELLKKRGYAEFMAGTISRTEFGKRLAQEWASFPVLAATKGGAKANGVFRTVQRGQSYYAGDGLNKALVAPETIEALLDKVRLVAGVIPAPDVPAAPQAQPPAPLGFFAWLKSFFA